MILKRNLSVVVIATLLLTFISTAIATPALGKSSRVAVITEMTGSATVKSAGGSREYDAYIDMGLSQGDYITTDAGSSVKVKIQDHEDEFTIGSNSVVSITTLADKGKGKKSKIKMFAGSVWSNVKKLTGGDDYEVETPTAVMAVRGTKVLTNVDNETGETYVAVAAGTVSAQTNTGDNSDPASDTPDSGGKEILIAPSQQLSLDSRSEVDDLETKVGIIDPEKLVGGTSAEIIEAIVKDKADIDRENAEFIAAQKEKIDNGEEAGISRDGADSSLTTDNQKSLDKVTQNLDNLIGNVVNTAIKNDKVDKSKIDDLIKEVNKTAEKKLDLDNVKPIDTSAGVDEALQKAKDEQLKKLEEAKKAADEAKKAAEDAAKAKLADALKKLEEEKARIAKEKEAAGLNKPTPTPSARPTATPAPTTAPTTPPTSPSPTSKPTVAKPTFGTASGQVAFGTVVNIATVTAGAVIHYTINGDAPTANSPLIGNQVTIEQNSIIRAIAVKSGSNNSEIATAEFKVAVETPTFSVPAGNYSSAKQVTISSTTSGAAIYYTIDGSVPSKSSTLYQGPIPVNSSMTINAIAIKDNFNNSVIATAVYTITIPIPDPALSEPIISYDSNGNFYLTLNANNLIDYSQVHGIEVHISYLNNELAIVPQESPDPAFTSDFFNGASVSISRPYPPGSSINEILFAVVLPEHQSGPITPAGTKNLITIPLHYISLTPGSHSVAIDVFVAHNGGSDDYTIEDSKQVTLTYNGPV